MRQISNLLQKSLMFLINKIEKNTPICKLEKLVIQIKDGYYVNWKNVKKSKKIYDNFH